MENNFQEKGGGWEGKHAVNICLAFWESVNILYIECVPPPHRAACKSTPRSFNRNDCPITGICCFLSNCSVGIEN